jgi:hypothetical protein
LEQPLPSALNPLSKSYLSHHSISQTYGACGSVISAVFFMECPFEIDLPFASFLEVVKNTHNSKKGGYDSKGEILNESIQN